MSSRISPRPRGRSRGACPSLLSRGPPLPAFSLPRRGRAGSPPCSNNDELHKKTCQAENRSKRPTSRFRPISILQLPMAEPFVEAAQAFFFGGVVELFHKWNFRSIPKAPLPFASPFPKITEIGWFGSQFFFPLTFSGRSPILLLDGRLKGKGLCINRGFWKGKPNFIEK